jgi:hypothetical protein
MYTVFHQDDAFAPQIGLTLEQAATELLTYDGHDFEIRDGGNSGFELWHTQFSRNGTLGGRPMVQTVIWSIKSDRAEAETEIFEKVIASGYWTPMEAMKDQAFEAMMAQIALENMEHDV